MLASPLDSTNCKLKVLYKGVVFLNRDTTLNIEDMNRLRMLRARIAELRDIPKDDLTFTFDYDGVYCINDIAGFCKN
jgi:hypothetical protein